MAWIKGIAPTEDIILELDLRIASLDLEELIMKTNVEQLR